MSWDASGFINRDDFSIFVNSGDTPIYPGDRRIKQPMPRPLKDYPVPLL